MSPAERAAKQLIELTLNAGILKGRLEIAEREWKRALEAHVAVSEERGALRAELEQARREIAQLQPFGTTDGELDGIHAALSAAGIPRTEKVSETGEQVLLLEDRIDLALVSLADNRAEVAHLRVELERAIAGFSDFARRSEDDAAHLRSERDRLRAEVEEATTKQAPEVRQALETMLTTYDLMIANSQPGVRMLVEGWFAESLPFIRATLEASAPEASR